MKNSELILLTIIGGMFISNAAADSLEFNVRVKSKDPPAEVTMQREDDIQTMPLSKGQLSSTFTISLPLANLRGSELRTPYRLVASWGDEKEQLYLAFRPIVPNKVAVDMFHEVVIPDRSTLDLIESLGTDFTSVLQKYFKARAFHRNWRFEQRLPYHQVSLRSARIWFDAAVVLAKWPNSFFRMDDEIKAIFDEYETKAAKDRTFRERYRTYAATGYIQGTMAQVFALNYKVAGEIPQMVAAGRYEQAEELNTRVLKAYSSESMDAQRTITKLQGVNFQLLKGNSDFIATKRATSR